MASPATQEDARLLLELYSLRREKVLRRARDFVGHELKFKNFKDYTKRYPEGSKQGTYVGMVLGYWDMACALVERGLLNEELFQAVTFEHVGVWFKLKALVEGWRNQYNAPTVLAALEAVATRNPAAASFQPPPEEKKSKGKKKKRR